MIFASGVGWRTSGDDHSLLHRYLNPCLRSQSIAIVAVANLRRATAGEIELLRYLAQYSRGDGAVATKAPRLSTKGWADAASVAS